MPPQKTKQQDKIATFSCRIQATYETCVHFKVENLATFADIVIDLDTWENLGMPTTLRVVLKDESGA